mmetsp:Transcript_4761/g.6008  ORF Transcript_4761/g.6008 Transcript_4761/m.6008 type:complete len:145 (+) Transcript_4761:250-684(+)
MVDESEKNRGLYRYWLPIQTRWKDNDMYGHVNNVVYYSFFDTIINHFLIRECGLQPTESDSIGLCVESKCNYFASLEYPEVVDIGLRVSKTGTSSVTYQVGIFKQNSQTAAAVGHFVHVFVSESTRKPVPIPSPIMSGIKQSLL